MGTRSAALAVGLLLVVGACDGGAAPVDPEVLSTTIVSGDAAPIPQALAVSDVEVVLDLWDWTTVRGPAVGFGPPALVSQEYVLYSASPVIVESLPTREAVLEHVTEASDVEWIIQDVVMGGEWVVLSETTVTYPVEYRITGFDLESGEEVVLAETDPVLPDRRAVPSLALEGSNVFWTETLPSGSVCVLSVDLEGAGATDVVACSDPGGNAAIVDIQVSRGTLSYVHSTYNPVRDTSCFELVLLELDSDEAGATVGRERCAAFQGAGVGSFAVWSEAQSGTDVAYDDLPMHGIVRGNYLALGSGVGGSVRVCHDHLYWKWVASDGSSSEVRTWEPGLPIRVIFEEDHPDWWIVGDIGCTDTNITLVRSLRGEGPGRGEILTARLP